MSLQSVIMTFNAMAATAHIGRIDRAVSRVSHVMAGLRRDHDGNGSFSHTICGHPA